MKATIYRPLISHAVSFQFLKAYSYKHYNMRRRPLCTSASRVTASFLLSFLAASVSTAAADIPVLPPPLLPPSAHNTEKEFSLRHIFHHGTYKYPELHRRIDVPEQAAVWMAEDEYREPVPRLRVKSEAMIIQRLAD